MLQVSIIGLFSLTFEPHAEKRTTSLSINCIYIVHNVCFTIFLSYYIYTERFDIQHVYPVHTFTARGRVIATQSGRVIALSVSIFLCVCVCLHEVCHLQDCIIS